MLMGALIGSPKVNTSLFEKEVNQSLEEFKKEEESTFPLIRESKGGTIESSKKDTTRIKILHG